MELAFPLQASPDSLEIPSDRAECLLCNARIGEVHGFVRLTAGAILYQDRKRTCGGPSEKMDAVFSLWHHGPHPVTGSTPEGIPTISMDNQEYRLDVIKPIPGGQVDIHFCSSRCLSEFFRQVVSALEKGMPSRSG